MSPKKWRQGQQIKQDRTWLSDNEIESIQSGRDAGAQPLSEEKKSVLEDLAEKFGLRPAWQKDNPEGGKGAEKK